MKKIGLSYPVSLVDLSSLGDDALSFALAGKAVAMSGTN